MSTSLFAHWKIDDKLLELGWKKHQIKYFKKGLVDSIEGNWNDNIINYSYDYESWYHEDYKDPKKKHGPVTYKEEAYAAGYEAGEEFIKLWVETTLNITSQDIFGDTT